MKHLPLQKPNKSFRESRYYNPKIKFSQVGRICHKYRVTIATQPHVITEHRYIARSLLIDSLRRMVNNDH